MNPTAALVVIMGLLGQPADVIRRDLTPSEPLIMGPESEVCRLAKAEAWATLAEVMAKNPQILVSIHCTLERSA